MNRIIKFRGRGQTDNIWHYGLFAKIKFKSEYDSLIIIYDGKTNWICDGNTLSEYTGMNDKNNKEIYEDMLITDGVFTYKVYWSKRQSGWCISLINSNDENRLMNCVSSHYTIVEEEN